MPALQKLDLVKQYKQLYAPSAKECSVVDVPTLHFFMIDGAGDPNTAPAYQEALEALYSASYTLKFMIKKGPEAIDYGVMPLEGLWWSGDSEPFYRTEKSTWQWTAMIMQPEFIGADQARAAIGAAKLKRDLPALERVRFETFTEGQAAQILYVGPYADEQPVIERLHAFIAEQGGRLSGRHHEIYLSDPRRTAPERLRTVIRQPFT